MQHQGEIEFNAIVGTDGRLHEPHLVTTLGGEAHEARVMRALAFWRLEPARKAKRQSVPSRLWSRATFQIY